MGVMASLSFEAEEKSNREVTGDQTGKVAELGLDEMEVWVMRTRSLNSFVRSSSCLSSSISRSLLLLSLPGWRGVGRGKERPQYADAPESAADLKEAEAFFPAVVAWVVEDAKEMAVLMASSPIWSEREYSCMASLYWPWT